MIVLVLYPILFYSYQLIPKDISTIQFFGYTYVSNYFESIYILMWTLVGKILPLIAFSFIYVRINHFWTYFLFVPITMYLFQIIAVINSDLQIVDSIEFFYSLPVFIFYCFLLYTYKKFVNNIQRKKEYERELLKTGIETIINEE